MVNPHRKALERMWKDRCSVFVHTEITDPDTNLTDFQETPLFEDQPCKLSFEKQTTTDENHVATVTQGVKLFLSPDLVIPAGCKIVVKRFNELEREFEYSQSGEAAPFTNHQEITLTLWEGWA
ncbi:MAG: hypothetical protein NC311_16450 [Muribaculaceae bacterium]|nr:hypothetical protein [Muribaculaceae bacterium]